MHILGAMQENARIGLEALSEIASLSVASTQRRLKRLRDEGIIVKDISILNPDQLGQSMSFVVMVEMERERPDQIDAFARIVRSDPQVQQCYYITGEADFCLICTSKDMKEFELLTYRLFFNNNNVRRFKTSVVMGRRKWVLALIQQ